MEKDKRNIKKTVKNQSGFTLLEIIAVIVILSILSVVAVPKYFDLQTQARAKAMDAATAEVIGRINSYFAEQVLSGFAPNAIEYTPGNLGTDTMSDEFTVTFNSGPLDNILDFTISAVVPGPLAGAVDINRTFNRPGV